LISRVVINLFTIVIHGGKGLFVAVGKFIICVLFTEFGLSAVISFIEKEVFKGIAHGFINRCSQSG